MLYPPKLHCNEMTSVDAVPRTEEIPSNGDSKFDELNVNVSEFQPERTAATLGLMKMNDMVANGANDK